MFSFNLEADCPEGVLEKHISVKAAAECSGYNTQYLRRLLRTGRLDGTKIGQVWLIRLASLETYLRSGQLVGDRRHGPRKIVADAGEGKTRRKRPPGIRHSV
jgi:excisionase family DNA binding protein